MMQSTDPFATSNLAFVEEQYARYLDNPDSIEESWREYFARLATQDGDRVAARRAVDGPSFRPSSIFDPPSAAAAPSVEMPAVFDPADLPKISDAARTERLELLGKIKLLRTVGPETLEAVARLTVEIDLADGEALFREGDAGDALFLVVEGHLVIQREGGTIATINSGEVVGELSVLDRQPRAADVVAHGPVRLLRLDHEPFHRLLDGWPTLSRNIAEVLAGRMRLRSSRQDRVDRLIHSYRVRGHLLADLDPLLGRRESIPELELESYGLSADDLDSLFSATDIGGGSGVLTLRQILDRLRATYCGAIGVQFMHIDAYEPKRWLIDRLEKPNRRRLHRDEQLRIYTKLVDAEAFEQFIHKKFLGAKRFSLEGAETLIPLLDLALEEASADSVDEVVIGMAHRGRLNVLVNIMDKSPAAVFQEFADDDPERFRGAGDVKYHLGYSSNRSAADGRSMHLSLCFNPSHLEFVNPVLMGRVRAKQDRFGDEQHRRCLGILIHGDAAFAGEGVVQEVLNMSELEGYRTGGTLHIIVNNQIGFTTSPESARSTRYATDVARMLQTPIFHVNGEDPEAVARVVDLAMAYRAEFGTDVIIDMYCYRKHGHNEGDEPSYTQPLMYDVIRKHKSVPEAYLDRLVELEEVTRAEAKEIRKTRQQELQAHLDASQEGDHRSEDSGAGLWEGYAGGLDADTAEESTALDRERLAELLRRASHVPDTFHLHRKLRRFFDQRREMAAGDRPLDWGSAEALAFASLLADGVRVRVSGQDAGRGTFSHRHAVLHDTEDGSRWIPLQHVGDDGGETLFQIFDSPLSEIGPLGFEYGYSLDTPDGLTVWEAQFGDFVNAAQVIVDQFISSSEDKWGRLSGLVMLLPHGFEGQGPEHSSARLERFLNMCAEDNMQVVNLTTPAQYFHCLRRQIVRPLRKPLVVMSPKSLLRLPEATSPLEDFTDHSFRRILADPDAPELAATRKVLLTSGKVFYDLDAARKERKVADVALIRLEQYYPLDRDRLLEVLAPYADDTPVVWVQEEPRNMGAWSFLKLRLTDGGRIFDRWQISCVSRPESASPATGSAASHRREQDELIERALS
ncbi:MAG: 2-oxoglutarate dehydrogenase E1 component [Acidobacteriota bacterium]